MDEPTAPRRSDRSRASADVKAVALAHITALEAKIAELEAMKRTLAHLAAHCHGDGRPDCPIIDDLVAAPAPARRSRNGATRFGPDHQPAPASAGS